MVLAFVGPPVEPITEALNNLGSVTKKRIIEKATPAIITSVLATAVPQLRPLIVIGNLAYAGYSYYKWTQSQQEKIQEKAVALKNTLTEGQEAKVYNVEGEAVFRFGGSSEGPDFTSRVFAKGQVYGPIVGPVVDTTPFGGFGWSPILGFAITGDGGDTNYPMFGQSYNPGFTTYHGPNYYTNNRMVSAKITKITPVDGIYNSGSTPSWKDLTPIQQQQALEALPPDDWKDVIETMPGSRLQPGQLLNSPTIFSDSPANDVVNFSDETPWNVPLNIPISSGSDPTDVGSPYELPVIPAVTNNGNIAVDPTTGKITITSPGTPDPTTGLPTPALDGGKNITVPLGPKGGVVFTSKGEAIPYGEKENKSIEPAPPDLQLPDIWNEIQKIKDALPFIAPAVGLIMAPALTNMLDQKQTQKAAKEGNCEALSDPDACPTPGMPGSIKDDVKKSGNKLDDIKNLLDPAAQAAQLLLLQNIDGKIGNVAKIGSLARGIGNTIEFLGASRFMEVITLITVLHNAFMLSNNLGQTLFSIIDNVANIPLKIANPNGEDFSSSTFFSTSIEKFFVGLFGKTTYAEMVAAYKAANNIISVGSNLLSNVQSIISDTQDIQNITNEWVRELGDALRDDGVISEENWEAKPDKPRFKTKLFNKLERMSEGLEVIDNALQSIEQLTSNLRSIVDTGNEIKTNFTALDKELTDAKAAAKTLYDTAVKAVEDKVDEFGIDDLY